MQIRKSRLRAALAMACAACALPAAAQSDSGDAEAGALVAQQIRQQGFSCAEPVTANRDPSVDDDAVWLLTCADAHYRVRLIPDQAAEVQRLD
ncbi:hypothetical protein [Mesorhizobium marinum]|uniref:PepSY domain-containing protein n=1 Tax=Mesorhizobium marinum TaxID=3228790 RepID=A0ABV3R340_9HYPH